MTKYSSLVKVVLIAALMIAAPNASAQSVDRLSERFAGVTPDNIFWGLDLAVEKISLLITLDPAEKAEKNLEMARERLLEVRQMTNENKLDDAAKAEVEFRRSTDDAASSVADVRRQNETQELEDKIRIERKTGELIDDLSILHAESRIRLDIRGDVTAEQRAFIQSIFDSMANKTGEIRIRIDSEKGRTKARIEIGAEEIERRIERGQNLEQEAADKIRDAEERISEAASDFTRLGLSNETISDAQELLARARVEFASGNFAEALSDSRQALSLVAGLKLDKDDAKERFEIKADVSANGTRVKVEARLVSQSLDSSAIANEILSRVKISRSDVAAMIKFENETQELEERMEIKADSKGDINITRFEWRFPLNIVDREAIITAVTEKLASLTVGQLSAAVEIKSQRFRVDVEAEDGGSRVKIRNGDDEVRFTLATMDRETIIQSVIERTGFSRAQVEQALEIESASQTTTSVTTGTMTSVTTDTITTITIDDNGGLGEIEIENEPGSGRNRG